MNDIGLIGLGVMGTNLILNIYDNYSRLISGFDIDNDKINNFKIITNEKNEILLFNNLEDFVFSLKKPRKIIILIPAGKYVDILLEKLLPLLEDYDNLLDGGNEWYKNIELRQKLPLVIKKQINYLGCGISGGENGARNGPCMMAGGSKKCYDSFNLILNKISAKFNNEVCVDYFGENGIGNYIKMVHNGIEYALMQLISEVYLILKISYGLTNKEISNVFNNWNLNKLNSYLLEITIKILNKKDETSNLDLLDIIKDQVDSKGTGYMTVVDALEKKIPINIIYSALEFRNISLFIPKVNVNILVQPLENKAVKKDLKDILINLENGLYFCFILTFFQGINLIYQHYYLETSLKLNLVKLLKVWRNGCIIKCNLLNEFIQFIENDNQEINKIIEFIYKNINYYNDLNIIIKSNDLPIITLSNCFQFSNILNSKKLHSAQLLQAMRDCFGGHMYERTDIDGKIHTNWLQN